MRTVVVAEALANKAGHGGAAWVPLSWIRGLTRLGLDVWFVEQLASTNDAARWTERDSADEPHQVAYFRHVVDRFGLTDRAVLLAQDEVVVGPPLTDVSSIAASAALVNIGGHLTHSRLFQRFRTRVMVDLDPGFTQFWHASGQPGDRVPGHDLYFTVGENIGSSSSIPTTGIEWRPIRQPVVLADWPVLPLDETDRFTTIANWRGPFGPIEFSGRTYGLKVHEFRKFIDLPRRCPLTFELALNIHPRDSLDLGRLRENGWKVTSPDVVATPESFRSYVQRSSSEFSVAQGIYVDTDSGWFSDRSVRYLASGRPVLVQDTGFSRHLPVGQGLLAFRTVAEAADGAQRVVTDYSNQAAAARALAEEHFDSDRVLARFCEQLGM